MVFWGTNMQVMSVMAQGVRTWTSAQGTYTTLARFVRFSVDGLSVTLRKEDGKEIEVKISQLSDLDQRLLATMKKPSVTSTLSLSTSSSNTMYTDGKNGTQWGKFISDITNEKDRAVVAAFLSKCKKTYDQKSGDLICDWRKPVNKKSYFNYDYTYPNGYGKDFAHLIYGATLTLSTDSKQVGGWLTFIIVSEYPEGITGESVCLINKQDHVLAVLPREKWKLRFSGDQFLQSGFHDLGNISLETLRTLVSPECCGISLGGKYTSQALPLNNQMRGIKELCKTYLILLKYYK